MWGEHVLSNSESCIVPWCYNVTQPDLSVRYSSQTALRYEYAWFGKLSS